MKSKPESRFNPYILGQLTLLMGGVALGLAILPQAILSDDPVGATILDVTSEHDATQQQLKPFQVASLVIAILGLCLGPIGWLRERPPVLPVCGMGLCAVALLWYWIVLGIALGVAIFIFFMLFGT